MDEGRPSHARGQDHRLPLTASVPRTIVFAAIVAAIYCGGGPTTPVISDPVLSSPNDTAVTGHNGQPPTVVFDTPVAVQAAPPVRVICRPASGTPFASGLTAATCAATAARERQAG